MNPTFTEYWLLQEEPGQHELMVHQLVERDHQWVALPHGSWADFLGTPEALHSLTQPETEIILNLSPVSENSEASNILWCRVQESPMRCTTRPVTAQHLALNDELQRHGKTLQVIQCDRLNDWPRAARFVLASAHEAKAIQTWANTINTPVASTGSYLLLAIRLYANTTREVMQKRMSMLLLAVGLLLAFHAHVNGLVFEPPKQPQAMALQKPRVETNPSPDWSEWQLKQKRFGENRQANITHLQFAWRSDGTLYSQASLQKARKRMPKGCRTFEQAPIVECIQTPQAEPTNQRGLR